MAADATGASTVDDGGTSMTSSASADDAPTGADETGPAGPEAGWSTRAALAMGPRQECGVAALGGEVYVVGGFSDAGLVPRVEAYDPASDSWRAASNFPNSTVHHPNLAAAGGRLWVAGFLSGLTFDAIGQTWSYDPATDVWSENAEMPAGTERGASAVAVIDTMIYVVGGLRQGQAVADAWVYDTAGDDWTPLPPLPTSRDHAVGAAIGGRVFVVGGRDSEIGSHVPTVDIYDPATGTWTQGADMPTSRGGAMGAAHEDLLFVGGGEGNPDDPDGIFGQWEVYDAVADSWMALPDMPTPRHGSGAAAVDGVVFVPGGAGVAAFGAVDTHEAWTVGG